MGTIQNALKFHKKRATITIQTIDEPLSKRKQRKSHAVAPAWLFTIHLTFYKNSGTMRAQKIGNKLPQEAKKSHGVAAPWLFRYFLPLFSNHQPK
jgi:hypothetical protein